MRAISLIDSRSARDKSSANPGLGKSGINEIFRERIESGAML
jgi:hypothetical protein